MRNTLIFGGSSCPTLTNTICKKLGMQPAEAELTQFSNVGVFLLPARCGGGDWD